MEEARASVEIEGQVFGTTADGHVLQADVRRHMSGLAERVAALEAENAEMRQRLEHLASLQRLAESTVVKADELAAEIKANARARADELLAAVEEELADRRRQFEAEQSADVAAARQRVEQLQAALEGSVSTLARALQAVGAPALEMPPPRAPLPPVPAFAPAAEPPRPAPRERSVEPDVPAASVERPWGEPAPMPDPTATADLAAADDGGAAALEPAEQPITGTGSSATSYSTSPTPFGPGESPAGGLGEAPEPEPGPSLDGPAPSEPVPGGAANGARRDLSAFERAAREPAPAAESTPSESGFLPGREEVPATVPADPGPAGAVTRRGPETIEIDMRPVKSFADLARVTKLLGGIAPGAQPVDLNLPQHRALFSVRGRDREALAAQLSEALPEAKVVERDNGIDVHLSGQEG